MTANHASTDNCARQDEKRLNASAVKASPAQKLRRKKLRAKRKGFSDTERLRETCMNLVVINSHFIKKITCRLLISRFPQFNFLVNGTCLMQHLKKSMTDRSPNFFSVATHCFASCIVYKMMSLNVLGCL